MIRNFKALGLALVAAFAFSAVTASGASAFESIFFSGAGTANTIHTGTSENTQVFTRGILTVNCAHAQFEGTNPTNSTKKIELQADYTTGSCTGPLNSAVHVDFTTGSCDYDFTGIFSQTAQVELDCTAGGQVTLTATNSDGSSLCTIHMPKQLLDGHAVFSNIEHFGIGSVTAELTISDISSTRTGSALCGPENHVFGTYSGNITLTGYVDNASGNEGAQIAISTK